jgi:phosphate transport system substrate-binding protein
MKKILLVIILLLMVFVLNSKPTDIILKGAGATFPHPLYKKWMKVYKSNTGVRINYQAVGSGKGIKALLKQEVDFGATDAFLSDGEMEKAGQAILHIPTCLGAVAIFYNLPGDPALRLTPGLLADIFLGKVTQWSDQRIAKLNKEVKLPDRRIMVVHRSDSSGTTFIFTNYLSAVCRQWGKKVGSGKIVRWPTGVGVERNPGVLEYVQKIPGAIGYVEFTYAVNAKMPTAAIQNRSGEFIKPFLESVSAAARVPIPPDTRTLIIDTSSAQGYPISGFTWLIFYKEQSYNSRTPERAKALARYLWWVTHEGQRYNREMLYGTLSDEAVRKAENIIHLLTFNGEKIVFGKQ